MDVKFCSLEEYRLLAQKLIYYYAPRLYGGSWARNIMMSDEAVGEVVHNLILADWRYNDSKGSLSKYRTYMAIYAIKNYVRNNLRTKIDTISMEMEICDEIPIFLLLESNERDPRDIFSHKEELEEIRRLLYKAPISDRQKTYISLYFFDGLTMQQIGDKYGITKQRVSQIMNRTIEDLRRYYANKI